MSLVPQCAAGLVCVWLVAACSSEAPAAPPSRPDATVMDVVTDTSASVDTSDPFAYDAPSCSKKLQPGMPCSMGNMLCPAPPDCESCSGGYVRRSASCVCGGGFWDCDQCGGACSQCDAGIVYQDPTCMTPELIDAAAAADARDANLD
jgi:hypothetical protein